LAEQDTYQQNEQAAEPSLSVKDGTRKKRSRFNRDPQPFSMTRVQQRDVEILEGLHSYRLLTTSHITSLFFNTKKRAEQRLRKLFDGGLVDRVFRPVVVGSAEIIYILSEQGASILSQETGIDREEIDIIRLKAKKQTPFFLDHFLDINQLRISLTLASKANGYNLLFWKYENELKNKSNQGVLVSDRVKDPENPGQMIPVSPDAFFGLDTPKGKAYFFLEADRATMSNSRFRRKMMGYARYWLDGVYQEKWGYRTFRVLTTTTKNRLPVLLDVTGRIRDKQLLPIFHFTDRDSVTPEKLFSEVWKTPDSDKAKGII